MRLGERGKSLLIRKKKINYTENKRTLIKSNKHFSIIFFHSSQGLAADG